MNALLDTNQVAERLQLSKRVVYELVQDGNLPCIRVGKRVLRYREADIDQWLDERRIRQERYEQAIRQGRPAWYTRQQQSQ